MMRAPILSVIIVFLLATTVQAADWPMRGHDAAHTGVAGDVVEPPLVLLWKYETGDCVYSSPAVFGGVVYVGSDDYNVYALDAGTGKLIWKYETDGSVYSSPAVSDGVVYVGSRCCNYRHNNGVYALDAGTGKLIWKYEIGYYISSSPAVSGGVVYVGSNYYDYSHNDNVYALDARTGKLIWKYKTGGSVSSSPAVSGGVVYVSSRDGNVYALDAGIGELIWKYETSGSVYSSPAVSGGIVYVGSRDDNVYALDAGTGKLIWKYKTIIGVDSSPAVSGGVVYVGSWEGNVYALDAGTGKLIWKYKTIIGVDSSPAVSGGVVYVGSYDNNVYALDAGTGKLIWKYGTGGDVSSSPAVSDGVVYVGSDDNNVYAFVSPKSVINEVKLTISQEKAKGFNMAEAESLLAQAQEEFQTGDYTRVITLIEQAKAETETIVKKGTQAEVAIDAARATISQEKAKGFYMTEAESLLVQAQEEFQTGDYTRVITLIEQAEAETEAIVKNGSQAKVAIDAARATISQEKAKGFYMTEAESLLAQAQEEFEKGHYLSIANITNQTKSLAVDIDSDGVPNDQDFAPAINNYYIYSGSAILLVGSVIALRTYYRLANERRRRKEEESRRLEEMKQNILDKIHDVTKTKGKYE